MFQTSRVRAASVFSRSAPKHCRYENLENIIGTLLGGRVTLFVPSCAMRELRQLAKDDPELRDAANLARNFMRHKDNCPPSESSAECLLKQVGAPLTPGANACVCSAWRQWLWLFEKS